MPEIMNIKSLNKLLSSEKNHCFGGSSKNAAGLQMEFYTNDAMDRAVSWLSGGNAIKLIEKIYKNNRLRDQQELKSATIEGLDCII